MNSLALSLLNGPTVTSIHDYCKTVALTRWTFVGPLSWDWSLLSAQLFSYSMLVIDSRQYSQWSLAEQFFGGSRVSNRETEGDAIVEWFWLWLHRCCLLSLDFWGAGEVFPCGKKQTHCVCLYVDLRADASRVRSHAWPVFMKKALEEAVRGQLKGEKQGPSVQGHAELSSEPCSFHSEATEVNKRGFTSSPEMTRFFPETPSKKLGCRSSLMSASAVWMSLHLKDSGRVPREDGAVTDWGSPHPHPRVASQ